MSKTGLKAVVIALAVVLSATAYAAGRGGGHGGGGGRGGGGMHFGGGGGRHFGGGGMHFGGGGGRHFGGGAVSRSFARPGGGNRAYSGRVNVNRAATRANRAASRAAARGNNTPSAISNRAVNNRAANIDRATARNQREASRRTDSVRNTMRSRQVAGALNNRAGLRHAYDRNRIAAYAATAGWRGNYRGDRGGWWRHRHGGYGWVGPLFWPFAYYDFYNYALWGNGYDNSFWDYGYNDIYAGLFSPYGYDDLAGYVPQSSGRISSGQAPGPATTGSVPPLAAADAQSNQLAQMCGQDGRDIAGLPIDQIQQAIQPNDEQRAALDDLANASVKAQQDIKAACPTSVALTAPSRLAAMQKRIEALIAAVQTVQPALDKFYGLLNDEQKARLTALGRDQRNAASASADTAQDCSGAQAGVIEWPTQKITDALQPTEAQRDSLNALAAASAKAADMLKASCQPSAALTPPARLAAAGQRLDTLLQATKTVSVALDDFYNKLTDEQKAQFEAIGPKQGDLSSGSTGQRSDASDTSESEPRSRHRRGHYSEAAAVRSMIRHFIRW